MLCEKVGRKKRDENCQDDINNRKKIEQIRMGNCMSQKIKQGSFNEKTSGSSVRGTEKLNECNDIDKFFYHQLCGDDNKKIILGIVQGFKNARKMLDKEMFNKKIYACAWKKVQFELCETCDLWGICQWADENDNVLNGIGMLYESSKNKQFLVGGMFSRGKLMKKKYYKIFGNGAYYVGQLNNELSPHGTGELHTTKTDSYKGEFYEGVPHGLGERKMEDRKFKGTFKKGEFQEGTQTTQKGCYTGTYKNNMKHGQGTLTLKNGYKYQGEFKCNKIDGEGTLWDKDSTVVYRGSWKNDMRFKSPEKALSIPK